MAQYALDFLLSLTSCFNCFPRNPTLTLNGHPYKILRLLGEGGFSLVYLVQSDRTGTLYALKKIKCPFGKESLDVAMREVEAYKLFGNASRNLIKMEDWQVVEDKGGFGGTVFGGEEGGQGGGKSVLILLPYYQRGNLQDLINANLINKVSFPEKELLLLFEGVCDGVAVLHGVGGQVDMEDEEGEESGRLVRGGENVARSSSGNRKAWAHRDIKPGNIMISTTGSDPIVMDFGSLQPSPIPIPNRTVALQQQDIAAEHSTLPYRAPELFDVKTDCELDTKVDIWSLGCTLFAAVYGQSPFEMEAEEGGGNLNLAICGGNYRFPQNRNVSEGTKEVIRKCLTVEPSERPDILELKRLIKKALKRLEEEE